MLHFVERVDIYDSGKLFEAQIAKTMPAEG
jgi:hypothetical protein